jgi:UDP-4-amino-4,6-dideoxy-N-acetyl-beta-L-altrosamine N-acetyltransferase
VPPRAEFALRPMTGDDVELVRTWRNADHVRRHMLTTHPIAEDEHRRWWDRSKDDPSRRLYVFEVEGTPAGFVTLVDIDPARERASWGFHLGATGLPHGTGSAMMFLALERAFEDLGIQTITACILPENSRSIHLHGRFGFRPARPHDGAASGDGAGGATVEMALGRAAWLESAPRLSRELFGE